jgi:hypothetical protein
MLRISYATLSAYTHTVIATGQARPISSQLHQRRLHYIQYHTTCTHASRYTRSTAVAAAGAATRTYVRKENLLAPLPDLYRLPLLFLSFRFTNLRLLFLSLSLALGRKKIDLLLASRSFSRLLSLSAASLAKVGYIPIHEHTYRYPRKRERKCSITPSFLLLLLRRRPSQPYLLSHSRLASVGIIGCSRDSPILSTLNMAAPTFQPFHFPCIRPASFFCG